uniref:Uncharacterized protein n=1 Tax=Glossina austeni TaxID=7395 RepID=A0A1A9VCN2_GLOAU
MFGLANNSNDIMLRDLEPFEQARRGSTASEPNSLSGSLSDLKIKSTPGDLSSLSLNQEIQIGIDLGSQSTQNTNTVSFDLTRFVTGHSLSDLILNCFEAGMKVVAASKHTCGDEHLANCTMKNNIMCE